MYNFLANAKVEQFIFRERKTAGQGACCFLFMGYPSFPEEGFGFVRYNASTMSYRGVPDDRFCRGGHICLPAGYEWGRWWMDLHTDTAHDDRRAFYN